MSEAKRAMIKVFADRVIERAMTAAGRAAISGDLAIRAGKFVAPARKQDHAAPKAGAR